VLVKGSLRGENVIASDEYRAKIIEPESSELVEEKECVSTFCWF
jgi:hypothetical protein